MIHYLIFPYNNFDQLELLVNKIKTKNSKVYIHVEKNVKDFPRLKDVYYIENRYHCAWGGTGILKAELAALSEAYKHMKKGDHAVFMSGQCFPIKKIDYIEKYIEGLGIKSSMSYGLAENYMIKRIEKYWFYDVDFHVPKFINDWLVNIIRHFGIYDKDLKVPVINIIFSRIISFLFPKRNYILRNYNLYKGQNWMVLSYEHVGFILNFLKSEKGKKFFKNYNYTLIPNETFFQTILLNYRDGEVLNNCLWYIKWISCSNSPKTLTINDFNEIKLSDKLFARKLDNNIDKGLLDLLNLF